MGYGDYYWAFFCGDYYRDPFPHSLLSTVLHERLSNGGLVAQAKGSLVLET